jgi:hypothetical protein
MCRWIARWLVGTAPHAWPSEAEREARAARFYFWLGAEAEAV